MMNLIHNLKIILIVIFQKALSQAMPPRKPEFPDWYKAFIQMLMSNGFMTGQEMFRGVKSICDSYSHSRNFPKMNTKSKEDVADMIEDMLEASNKALEPLQLHVSKIQEEEKTGGSDSYNQYYVLAPTYENEQLAKLQTHFGERELEWLKLVATHLVESEEKIGGQTELVNLVTKGGNNSTKKKLNVAEADTAMEIFTAAGYLMKVKRGHGRRGLGYGLGPRFMVEMDRWMKQTFEDEIWECGKCGKIGMIGKLLRGNCVCNNRLVTSGVSCTRSGCGLKFHKYCVDTGKKDPRCTRCKSPLKIDGVATKRH